MCPTHKLKLPIVRHTVLSKHLPLTTNFSLLLTCNRRENVEQCHDPNRAAVLIEDAFQVRSFLQGGEYFSILSLYNIAKRKVDHLYETASMFLL